MEKVPSHGEGFVTVERCVCQAVRRHVCTVYNWICHTKERPVYYYKVCDGLSHIREVFT